MEMQGALSGRPPRRGPSLGMVVFLAILFGAVAGFGGTLAGFWAVQQGYVPGITLGNGMLSSTSAAVVPAMQGKPHGDFVRVAEALNGSVVNINTLSRQQSPYSWFYGGGSQVVQGLGTGVIVSSDGYILTNYHVVGDADNIKVTVIKQGNETQEYTAEYIGGDKQEDLALIRIKARGLQPVRFGNSDHLQPGEAVMAIGNPFGFEHTVSVGVVSALNRQLPVEEAVTLRGMVQTDASINPGNSGGPLVNAAGEIVGINTAVFVGGGNQPQANSIGFAIPSNHAKRIMEMLRRHGKVEHPYVGIRYTLITSEIRQQQHLQARDGVLVESVYTGGPADKAGVQAGDIIERISGKALKKQNDLGDIISAQKVGATVEMQIQRWHGGQSAWVTKTIKVKIADMPKEFLRRMTPQQPPQEQHVETGPRGQEGQGDQGFPFPWPF